VAPVIKEELGEKEGQQMMMRPTVKHLLLSGIGPVAATAFARTVLGSGLLPHLEQFHLSSYSPAEDQVLAAVIIP